MKRITSFEQYTAEYKKSVETPEKFWSEQAEEFVWKRKWDNVLEWNFDEPNVKWFQGGKLNITENCLDRHLKSGKGDQVAILWEPNHPEAEVRKITYKELHLEVCRFANVLKRMEPKKATAFVFICRWCPNLLLLFWPAHELEPFIQLFLAAFHLNHLLTGFRMQTVL